MTNGEHLKKVDDIPDGGYAYLGNQWYVRPPGCPVAASIGSHDITLHDDGTITVHPSILYDFGEYHYHGWLVHGEWRSA